MLDALISYGFVTLESALTSLKHVGRACLRPTAFRRAGRFVPFRDRVYGSDFHPVQVFRKIQGGKDSATLHWRAVPMKKDPFDQTLYPLLLWELRPATVIELGAFKGGSAIWVADLMSLFEIDGRVFSFDIDMEPIVGRHDRATFLKGDSNDLSSFGAAMLRKLAAPLAGARGHTLQRLRASSLLRRLPAIGRLPRGRGHDRPSISSGTEAIRARGG
jgi:hypothetical protein